MSGTWLRPGSRRVLGFCVGVTDDGAAPLLTALASVFDVRAWPCGDHVDVVVATSPDAPALPDAVARHPDAAVVVVAEPGEPVPAWLAPREPVLVRRRRGAPGSAAGPGELELPEPALDLRRWWALPPFVRAGWRARRGVGGNPVAVVDGGVEEVPARTALSLAAAAVATGSALRWALALGTPTVTGPADAAAVGARDGVDVVVVDDPIGPDGRAAARALAGDEARAAALGRRARRLVERQWDLAPVVRSVADLAGGRGARPIEAVMGALDELCTPPFAHVAVRARIALRELEDPAEAARVAAAATVPA